MLHPVASQHVHDMYMHMHMYMSMYMDMYMDMYMSMYMQHVHGMLLVHTSRAREPLTYRSIYGRTIASRWSSSFCRTKLVHHLHGRA